MNKNNPGTSNDSGFSDFLGSPDTLDNQDRLSVFPSQDKILMGDDRVVDWLGEAEKQRRIPDYWARQKDLAPRHRTILVQWMSDVCQAEGVEAEVLPLAVSVVDRFLAVQPVYRNQLQAAGTTAILIASKVKQPRPIGGRQLVDYTENTVTLGELVSWELLMLNKLDWDVAGATGLDFLSLLLQRLPHFAQLRDPAARLLPHLLLETEVSRLGPVGQGALVLALTAAVFQGEDLRRILQAAAITLQCPVSDLAEWQHLCQTLHLATVAENFFTASDSNILPDGWIEGTTEPNTTTNVTHVPEHTTTDCDFVPKTLPVTNPVLCQPSPPLSPEEEDIPALVYEYEDPDIENFCE